MVNYNDLSDFDINKLVAKTLGENVPSDVVIKSSPYLHRTGDKLDALNADGTKVERTIVADYCNNFNDWYPLAEKYGMSLDVSGRASIPKSISKLDHVVSHNCELARKLGRAVAICVLKIKDSENV